MSWLKMGRWVLVGAMGMTCASACGGRGNLPGGELIDELGGTDAVGGAASTGGARATGGTTHVGGAQSVAGTTSSSGAPSGGVSSFGGTFGVAGTTNIAGAPSICVPGRPFCDATGRFQQVCTADGRGVIQQVDCVAQGRRCQGGTCSCPIDQADCDGNPKNGCETATTADLKNCGGCGVVCSSNHVKAKCSGGACDGACAKNFADCNGNKQLDGCESDSLTDAKNCGACGVACSTRHVQAVCDAGVCSGDCAAGFADCNTNKQTDGCEINTKTDKLNCGGCGNSCADGLTCVDGTCSSLLTFTGIAQDLPIASLTGWSQCFLEPYGTVGTLVDKVEKACAGSKLMLACRVKGSDTLQLAAYAPRADVLFDTGMSDVLHVANDVGWYFSSTWSWGFAPPKETVLRNNCDVGTSSADLRMCWHTLNGGLDGGYRCGADDGLNQSFDFERLVFQAP